MVCAAYPAATVRHSATPRPTRFALLIQLHQKLFRIQQTEMQSIFGKAREEDTFMFSKKSAPPSQLWQRTVYYKLRLCCCLPSKVYNL